MIDITTSGTMTERTLNQRSPIHSPGNSISQISYFMYDTHIFKLMRL